MESTFCVDCLQEALWIFGTFIHRVFPLYPYIWLKSLTKRCGKTRALEIISSLSFNGSLTTAPTEAVLFREPGISAGTLCWDEAEKFGDHKEKGERLSVLNAAYRKGVFVKRCEGEDNHIAEFEVFRPIVLAGISSVPDTVADRSFKIELERKLQDQKVARLQIDRLRPFFQELIDEMFILALTKTPAILEAYENIPENLTPQLGDDRLLDGLEIMFSIAAGVEYLEGITILQEASVVLGQARVQEEQEQNHLLQLADILLQELGESEDIILRTSEVASLCNKSEADWPTKYIQSILRKLGFRSGSQWKPGGKTVRAYKIRKKVLLDFKDRYGGSNPTREALGPLGTAEIAEKNEFPCSLGSAPPNGPEDERKPLIIGDPNAPNG